MEVDGRTLLVSAAVTRDKAAELKLADHQKQKVLDARNLYLAAEGVIRDGDQAARMLTPAELSLRQNAERIKAKKLQARPSLARRLNAQR
eukprot:SAG11_NODE_1601_length_4605_cov_2.581891_5_plen_90_part_00